MTKYYNEVIGKCDEGKIEVILLDDKNYSYVKEQLILAINNDENFIDKLCKNYLDHKYVIQNLYNIIIVKSNTDENNIIGLASYNIVDNNYKKLLKLFTLCSNNKCGTIIINLLKYIAYNEDCDNIKVMAISPAIGFYWRMGFRFLINGLCLYYSDNELARNERLSFEKDNKVILSKDTLENLQKFKLYFPNEDSNIMTYCIKNEDEYMFEED